MMGNLSRPKSDFMFPHLRQGEIATALKSDTRLDLVSADDIGSFARAAFEAPSEFNRRNIDIAAESLTMVEVAAILSRICGKAVTAVELSPAEARARGLFAGWINTQEWLNEVGYQVDIGVLKSYGVPLSTFEQWAVRHRAEVIID
jgi:nucleoside-diphosphate-sugar epimerase